jgi:hypothetical protein
MSKDYLADNFILKKRIGDFLEWWNTLSEEQLSLLMDKMDEFKKELKKC